TPGPRCASSRHSPRESRSVAPRPRCGWISRRSVRMGSSTPEAADPSDAVSSELIDTLERGRRPFLALVDHVRPELLRYFPRMPGSVADGEDVVQETWARACYELPQMQVLPPLRPWLFRIAHDRAIDHWRHEVHRAIEPLDPAIDLAGQAALEPASGLARQ